MFILFCWGIWGFDSSWTGRWLIDLKWLAPKCTALLFCITKALLIWMAMTTSGACFLPNTLQLWRNKRDLKGKRLLPVPSEGLVACSSVWLPLEEMWSWKVDQWCSKCILTWTSWCRLTYRPESELSQPLVAGDMFVCRLYWLVFPYLSMAYYTILHNVFKM